MQQFVDAAMEIYAAERAVVDLPAADQPVADLPLTDAPVAELPIIVGVTGHRNLVAASLAELEATLSEVLTDLRELFPSMQVACGFAEGADQLVGRIANKLNIPLVAVLPMPRGAYRDSLPARARAGLDDLVGRAELTLELPWVTEAHDHTDQYEQLGLLLARRSHILLALWDGEDEERGRGGTAHVVHMRQTGSQKGRVFVDSVLFPDSRSRLDLAHGGPILHVPIRREAASGAAHAAPAALRLWRGDGAAGGTQGWQPIARVTGECLAEQHFPVLYQIRQLNREIRQIVQTAGARAAEHLSHLGAEEFPGPPLGSAAPFLQRLRRLQTNIDLVAQDKRRPLLGAHLVLTLAVPAPILCFELYSNAGHSRPLLAGYLVIMLAAMLYSYLVQPNALQAKFQDYRALAEALRVQLFWSLSAVPQAVSDSYLRKQQDDLGWIRDALHGPALWATAVALAAPRPDRHQVEAVWLRGQKTFFIGDDGQGGRARSNRRTWKWCQLALDGFAGAGVAAGAVLLLVQLGELADPALQRPAEFTSMVLITLVGILPAIATGAGIYAGRLALEQQAHTYGAMGTLFARALHEARHISTDTDGDEAFRDLVKELGREALDENAEWLKEHRKRPIKFSTGA